MPTTADYDRGGELRRYGAAPVPITPAPEPNRVLLRYSEAAKELRMSERSLKRLIQSGELAVTVPGSGRRPSLIERQEITDYLDRRRVAARRRATHRKRSHAARR